MKLSRKEVDHIADLARLELSDDEKERYAHQLSDILDYVASLQTLDTASIPPTASVFAARSALRDDEPAQSLQTADILRNAPAAEQDQFRVPPVLE
jgi:aspartyl-tRNA(Asn)/glutamyl-tRNA(Gln) amidotransferase subunit C